MGDGLVHADAHDGALAILLLDPAKYVGHLVVLFHAAFVEGFVTEDLVVWFVDGVHMGAFRVFDDGYGFTYGTFTDQRRLSRRTLLR